MWILGEIRQRGGVVGFREFMELALYHRGHGYYASENNPWGRDGDFLTAPTASGWYGATWAGFLTELAARSGRGLGLVDLAAGDGSFVASVLDGLGERAVEVVTGVVAVERSTARWESAGSRLAEATVKVEIVPILEDRGEEPSIIHASELYDAMPVHRVEQTPEGLLEMVVAVKGDGLEWRRRPAGTELVRYFDGHGVRLEDGQIAEINLEAEPFHREILEAAGEGVVAILDYGYDAKRLYDSRGRRHGSLVSYRRHQVGRDLLEMPGQQDLTAHVNWDDLRRAATSCGWTEIGLMPLAEFLVRAGIGERVQEAGYGMEAELDADTVTARQEIKRLLDPEGMGSDLKVLIQGKGELGEIAAEILQSGV